MSLSTILISVLICATLLGATFVKDDFENCENKETEFVYCYGIKDGQTEFGTTCLEDKSCESMIKIELIDTFTSTKWDTLARFTFASNSLENNSVNALLLEFESLKVLCSTKNMIVWDSEKKKQVKMKTKDRRILSGNTCSFNYSKSGKMRTELGFDPFEEEHVITLSTVDCTTTCDTLSVANKRPLGTLDGWSKLLINQRFRYDACFETVVGLIYPCYPFMFSQRQEANSCLENGSCDGLFHFADEENVSVYMNMKVEDKESLYFSVGLSHDRYMGGDIVFDCLSTSTPKRYVASVSENQGQYNVPLPTSQYKSVITKMYARTNGMYIECLWTIDALKPFRIGVRDYYLDSIMGRYTVLMATGDLELGTTNKEKHRLTQIYEPMKFPQYESSVSVDYYLLLGIAMFAVVGISAQFLYCEWDRIRGGRKLNEFGESVDLSSGEFKSDTKSRVQSSGPKSLFENPSGKQKRKNSLNQNEWRLRKGK